MADISDVTTAECNDFLSRCKHNNAIYLTTHYAMKVCHGNSKVIQLYPISRTAISEFHFTPWLSCPIKRHRIDFGNLQATREPMRGEFSYTNIIYWYVLTTTADRSGTTWENLPMVHNGSTRTYFVLGYIHENNSTARPSGN